MVSTMKIVDTKRNALKAASTRGVRVNRTGRRTYTQEYKRAVVRECDDPGVSVAGVALAHGINANLLRRWIVRQRRGRVGATTELPAVLLPVSVQRDSPAQEASIKRRCSGTPGIEIELYGVRIYLRGGVDAQTLRTVLDVLSRR